MVTFGEYTVLLSCGSIALGLKKNRIDGLGATLPPIVKKTAVYGARFGQINLIYTQIL